MLTYGETTTEEISRTARRGISGEVIQHMVDKKLATTKDVAYVLGVNERTVRTYQREASNLSPQQSEQLLKYNCLLRRGKEVFGSDEAFNRWLRKPAYGLDNDVPLAYLVTSEGINLVSDEVERIANGEFA
jgi:putative toxin-antitoxin system antitoxin component (TIGR02293 family)